MTDPRIETAQDTQDSSPPVSVRLSDELSVKLGHAFRRAAALAGGEKVTWDMYLLGAPNPMVPGQIQTGLAIVTFIRGVVLGETITNTCIVAPVMFTEAQETFDQFARDRVQELLAARQQQAQEIASKSAAGNGNPPNEPPAGGLFVPGR